MEPVRVGDHFVVWSSVQGDVRLIAVERTKKVSLAISPSTALDLAAALRNASAEARPSMLDPCPTFPPSMAADD